MFDWVLVTSLTQSSIFAWAKLWIRLYTVTAVERCSQGKLLWKSYTFLKYMLEIPYHNKHKTTAKYMKRSHFKNVETKTKKYFYKFSEKNSSKKWFPTQLNSIVKNYRTTAFQESLALNFKWNALTARIPWQHTHS